MTIVCQQKMTKTGLNKCFKLFFFWAFLLPQFLFANDSVIFQKAYQLEKKSTLFSIPLYESVLSKTQNPKIIKATVGRLFFLYKKHNKLFEAVLLGSKYSSIISSKERSEIWIQLAKIYEPVTISELMQAYTLALRSKSDSIEELKFYLLSVQKKPILEFTFLLLYKRKDYEIGIQLIRSDLAFQFTPLYEGMYLLKTGTDKSRDYLETQLKVPITYDEQTSDLSFLLGHYFRNRGDFAHSARFFRMSARGRMESAKSLLQAGSKEEACKGQTPSIHSNDEYTAIFSYYCSGTLSSQNEDLLHGMDLFAKKDGSDILSYMLSEKELR